MNRKNDRRHAIRLVFSLGFVDYDESVAEDYFRSFECVGATGRVIETPSLTDRAFVINAYNGVARHLNDIDDTINANAVDWPVDRISKVDLAILRLGVYEMFFNERVPVSVAVNEATASARYFGGNEAADFVYAVLAAAEAKNHD